MVGIEVGVTADARQEHKSLEGDSEFVSAELVLLADDTQMTLARRTGFILNPAAVQGQGAMGLMVQTRGSVLSFRLHFTRLLSSP